MDERLPDQELLSWSFPEFNPARRTNAWYLWFGIASAFFIFLGVMTDNFLFSIIIILAALITFLRNWRRPGQLRFALTPQSIQVGSSTYPLKDFKEFWIVYQPGHVETLYVEFKSTWRPLLAIPLEGNNPLQIREVLLQYLPENLDKDEEPASDTVARLLNL